MQGKRTEFRGQHLRNEDSIGGSGKDGLKRKDQEIKELGVNDPKDRVLPERGGAVVWQGFTEDQKRLSSPHLSNPKPLLIWYLSNSSYQCSAASKPPKKGSTRYGGGAGGRELFIQNRTRSPRVARLRRPPLRGRKE